MVMRSFFESFFECFFGITKSPEQIRQEIEESNEENYRNHKLNVLSEAREFKNKHKEILEYQFKKNIQSISLKELIDSGFNSNHFTRKHCEELGLHELTKKNIIGD